MKTFTVEQIFADLDSFSEEGEPEQLGQMMGATRVPAQKAMNQDS